jgi:hypothetical protein
MPTTSVGAAKEGTTMLFDDSRFTGSWRFMIYPEAGTTPGHSLGTLCTDGSVITSPPAVEEFPPHPTGVVHVSTGHGAWAPAGDGAAVLTFMAQASGGDGSFVGVGTVDARLALSPDGDSFQGTYEFAMADVVGTVFATEQGTVRGTRITVNALVTAVR